MAVFHNYLDQNRLVYLRDLLRELVVRDMKLRYKRSKLGMIWSLINPLAQVIVLSIVFRFILPTNIPNFTVFLFVGVLSWNWFSTALHAATDSIVNNGVLIRRPGFPIVLLPIVTVSTHMVHFFLALPILLLFMIISGLPVTPALLVLPIIIALQFIITVSLSYFSATLHVFFRDTRYLLGIVLMLGFYLSPVFYSPAMIPQRLQPLYFLNPMAVLITAYRRVVLEATLPDPIPLISIGAVSLILFWLGLRKFKSASYRFAEEL
jgi:lipopolysaccharide transport system permease protein